MASAGIARVSPQPRRRPLIGGQESVRPEPDRPRRADAHAGGDHRATRGRVLAILGALLLALIPSARSQVASAVTGEALPGVRLELPPAYLLFAPVSGIWDAMTVFSVTQHLAVLGGIGSLFLAWRFLRRRPQRNFGARLLREALAALGACAALFAFYAAGAAIPRPMAKLRVADPEVVVVDFHSHTHASHDGRRGFTTEHNRAWHRAAGFHVAYVTDHGSLHAGLAGQSANPARAGDGTVILVGREVVLRKQHVAVLGTVDPRPILASVPEGGSLGDAEEGCPAWPVIVHTIPEDLSLVPLPECETGAGGVAAIELLDSAPRGLGQSDRERDRIVRIADSLDLALVASSNLHGWGRTASGWSLLRIPEWREISPKRLGERIEQTIRREGRQAVEVVAHRRPVALREGIAAAGIPFWFALDFVSRLTRLERLSWLLWFGLIACVALRARRARSASP